MVLVLKVSSGSILPFPVDYIYKRIYKVRIINVKCKNSSIFGYDTSWFAAYNRQMYSRDSCLLFSGWMQVSINHLQLIIRPNRSIYKYLMEKNLEIFYFLLPQYLLLIEPHRSQMLIKVPIVLAKSRWCLILPFKSIIHASGQLTYVCSFLVILPPDLLLERPIVPKLWLKYPWYWFPGSI